MAVYDDPKTLGRARLSFADEADIDQFADMLGKFESGEITADQWRGFRLLRGTYGQRQTYDSQMMRVKMPQGLVTAEQLYAFADVADRYSRGFGHITTRQNMQFHFVKLHDAEPAMRRMAEAGLTTREACGNSVRNITACAYAGISPSEPFDVTPSSEALTRYFLRHRLASSLPRKFKIGFEGCAEDHVKATINDIGWLAREQDGTRGFKVIVGAGTATMTSAGHVLYDFMPMNEMFNVAEAIVRVFHGLGDYKHKHKNRMKFLIKALGWDNFRAAFEKALADVHAEGGFAVPAEILSAPAQDEAPDWDRAVPPSVQEIAARVTAGDVRGPGIRPEPAPVIASGEGAYLRWAATNIRQQKQPGYVAAIVTVHLGDLTSEQMRVLADLSRAYADGTARVTPTQNLVFRWVRREDARGLFDRLAAASLALGDADTIADVTSCPGAESCKLAVTQSRGLGQLLEEHVRANRDLIALAPGLDAKVSGCPNGCGQHHIAAVGFQGSLRKLDGKALPQYFVMVGGGVGPNGATFGRLVAKIPARRSPQALDRLARLYAAEHQGDETPQQFFTKIDLAKVKAVLADLEPLTAETAREDDFIDLAETHMFAPETTEGECAT